MYTNASMLVIIQDVSWKAAAGVGALSVRAVMVTGSCAQSTLVIIWSIMKIILYPHIMTILTHATESIDDKIIATMT